jgi:hypothetical protein
MNMLTKHRRNPRRNRNAPKKFEDEKFVSGAIDRYQHCYEANKHGKYDNINGDEDYYTTRDGRKFVTYKWGVTNGRITYRLTPRDFIESILEFTSIWRDIKLVIPSEIIPVIASFLNIKDIDKQLIKNDDEFIAADESENETDDESENEDSWNSEDETDVESEWSEYDD